MVSSPVVAVLKVYPFNRCAVGLCNCPRGVRGAGGGGEGTPCRAQSGVA